MDTTFKHKKVVVTGGAGFIGSHLVDALVADGYEVVVIDDLSAGKREQVNPNAKLLVVSILDKARMEDVMRGADTVFHLAAIPQVQYSIEHPEETYEVNAKGTRSVLEAARVAGVRRVVYSASSAVYGNSEAVPLHEDTVPAPLSPYALQKYTGELECKLSAALHGIEAVSLRYFNVYGSRQDPHSPYSGVVGRFLFLRKENKPLTVVGDGLQTRDFIHVSDVVRANILAMKSSSVGHGEVLNIGTGKEVSARDVADMIGGVIEHISPRIEPRRSCADVSRSRELLGWEPAVSLEDGLRELKREYGIS